MKIFRLLFFYLCNSLAADHLQRRQKIRNSRIFWCFLWMRCAQNFIKDLSTAKITAKLVLMKHVGEESANVVIRKLFSSFFALLSLHIKLAFLLSPSVITDGNPAKLKKSQFRKKKSLLAFKENSNSCQNNDFRQVKVSRDVRTPLGIRIKTFSIFTSWWEILHKKECFEPPRYLSRDSFLFNILRAWNRERSAARGVAREERKLS